MDLSRHRAESPFWRFSLRFYGRPGISDACVALQDGAGADVNLLLFLLFLADHGIQVSAADIARLDGAVAQWRDTVIKPLRSLRRALKQGVDFIPGPVSETFRAQIKRMELESEQIEQHRLEEFMTGLGSPAQSRMAAAEASLALYSATLQAPAAQAIQTILHCFAGFVPIEPPLP